MVQVAVTAGWFFSLACVIYAAALFGEWQEKTIAVAMIFAWLASLILLQATQTWVGPHVGLFIIDLILFLLTASVGLLSSKTWPLVACGFELCAVCLHLAFWAQPRVLSSAYFVALQITSFAVLFSTAFGTFQMWLSRRHLQRLDR